MQITLKRQQPEAVWFAFMWHFTLLTSAAKMKNTLRKTVINVINASGNIQAWVYILSDLNLKNVTMSQKPVWVLKESDPDRPSHAVSLHCAPQISDVVFIRYHVHITVSVVSEVIGIVYCLLLDCLNTYAVKTKGFNGTFILHVYDWQRAFYPNVF